MKTITFLLFVMILLTCPLNSIIAQSDFSDEILVYLLDGIQKGKNNQVEKVVSEKLKFVFSTFNITYKNIFPAFPDFNKSDTIKITSDGEIIRLPNMANVYKIKLIDKTY